MSHDNLNIAFQVFSQRVNNQIHFESGTAATIYIKPDEEPIPDTLPKLLREKRVLGMTNSLNMKDIMQLDCEASDHLQPFLIHEVLKFLLQSSEFDLGSYKYHDNNTLKGPDPLNPLPYGPKYTI